MRVKILTNILRKIAKRAIFVQNICMVDENSTVNIYPVNWSVEKTKKESNKSCKNYLGVVDFDQTDRGICTKSNTLKQLAQERARTTALEHWYQVRSAESSALTAPRLEAV